MGVNELGSQRCPFTFVSSKPKEASSKKKARARPSRCAPEENGQARNRRRFRDDRTPSLLNVSAMRLSSGSDTWWWTTCGELSEEGYGWVGEKIGGFPRIVE